METQELFSYHCQCCWHLFFQAQFPETSGSCGTWCTTRNVRRKCKSLLPNPFFLTQSIWGFMVTPQDPFRVEEKDHFILWRWVHFPWLDRAYSHLHLPRSSQLCKYSVHKDPFRKQEWHLDELPDQWDIDSLCMLRCNKHPSWLKEVYWHLFCDKDLFLPLPTL